MAFIMDYRTRRQIPCCCAELCTQAYDIDSESIKYKINTTRDVKFVSFPNSNFVCKIGILFELRLVLW